MFLQRAVGAVGRRLPRGRGAVATWLRGHPGDGELEYRDHLGLLRTVDLRDEIESRWFTRAYDDLPGWVVALISPTDWVIDAGANVGTITSQLARAAHRGRVWACEPVPRNIARLRLLRDRNDLSLLDVLPVALGARDGILPLRVPAGGGSGWSTFTASWVSGEEIQVPVRSLDSLVAERGRPGPLRFIKIDVEGYEPELLQGASALIREERPLLYVELNDPILRDRGSSGKELIERVVSMGYRMHPKSERAAEESSARLVDVLFEAT